MPGLDMTGGETSFVGKERGGGDDSEVFCSGC